MPQGRKLSFFNTALTGETRLEWKRIEVDGRGWKRMEEDAGGWTGSATT
jgi:hypothetical protein